MMIRLLEDAPQELEDALLAWKKGPGVYDIPQEEFEAAKRAPRPLGYLPYYGVRFRGSQAGPWMKKEPPE